MNGAICVKKSIAFAILFLLCFSSYSQQATVIRLPQLKELLNRKTDTTYVINFWATWCKPCVEELPGFREAEQEVKNQKVKFIYISLDFKRQLESTLNPFLKKNNFHSLVYLMDEPDYDSWINLVDSTWQGAIPATLIYNHSKGRRVFFEKELSKKELVELVSK